MRIIIEIIGPSGVGKSTLLSELRGGDRLGMASWKCQPSGRLPAKNQNRHDDTPHFKLLEEKILNISTKQINSVQKAFLLNYLSEIILRDLYIRFEDNRSKYFMDEGILHNFAQEFLTLSDKDFLELLNEKSFIYIRPDEPETVVERILKRANEGGHMTSNHQGLSYQELIKLTENSVLNFDNLTQRLENCGFRVLRLCAESEKEKNQEAALKFISKIPKNKFDKILNGYI